MSLYNEKTFAEDKEGTTATVQIATAETGGETLGASRVGLRRTLKNRHVAFVGFGGGIGVGLFVGAGASLAKAGPLGLWLAFCITGFIIWNVINSIAEVATQFPVAGGFPHFVGRFADPALGFALGWNYWYAKSIAVGTELSAVATLISYWSDLNAAIWITITLIPILIINFMPVKFFGEAEIVSSSIKVITLAGLIILGIVIDLGGGPNHDRLGFRYWKSPGAMNELAGVGGGAKARFLAFFTAFINAAFSYSGTEVVVLTAAEASNPVKQIPKATTRLVYRIVFFYVIGTFVMGLIIPFDYPGLTAGTGNAASSPWVLAIQAAGIMGLPSVINAAIITSAWSAGNTYLFIASRTLLALSLQGQAPKFLQRTTKRGVPYVSVGISACLALFSYLSAGKGGPAQAFTWLSSITTLSALLNWCSLCLTAIGFQRALRAQGISRSSLAWHAPLQPYASYFSIAACLIIAVFSGFTVFLKGAWSTSTFISKYISFIVYLVPFLSYKIIKKTKFVKPAEADLVTGRLPEEEIFDEPAPTTWYGKVLDRLI